MQILYIINGIVALRYFTRRYSRSMAKQRKESLPIHSVVVRFGPLFADEKGIFVTTRQNFFYLPHGAQSATTSVRAFYSGLYVREGSFLPCTKARPGASVKGRLCQGTPSEGFARRKVIWDRKLWVIPRESRRCARTSPSFAHVIAIVSVITVSNLVSNGWKSSARLLWLEHALSIEY